MPELPEVETVVRGLRAPLLGRRIIAMWHDWDKTIATPSPPEMAARLEGQTVNAITRRAKYVVCELDHGLLMVHLKMTGRLYVVPAEAQHDADRWVHFKLTLDNGHELRFSDFRKFGRVYFTEDLETITGALGPEPLDPAFTLDVLRERLKGRKRVLKPLLLDQTFVAGLGNIYADEALHRAGLHPLRLSQTLDEAEIARLHQMIVAALSDGVAREGASINWYRKPDGSKGSVQETLTVYGRTGEPCHTCGTPIEKIRVGQRGTHFCPVCQPLDLNSVAGLTSHEAQK